MPLPDLTPEALRMISSPTFRLLLRGMLALLLGLPAVPGRAASPTGTAQQRSEGRGLGDRGAGNPPSNGTSSRRDRAAKPLNVVFILADDLGWGELGSYGQRKIPTPNLDRLAAQGMRFTQHYSGAPVCAPSRCVLMTGKHLGHSEVRGNQQAQVAFPEFTEGQHPLSERAVTFVQVFQKAGYATGAMGKWGLGPVGSTGDPNRKGFDLFFGYNCQAVAHSHYPPHLWRNSEKVSINTRPVPGHAKRPEGDVGLEDWIGETHAPRLMVGEAEKFIAANATRPFFLYLPFIEPHVAMHPPRESVERFPVEWDREVYRGANGYLPHPRPRAAYAAMIHDLDDHVGRVLAALDRAGVADRTLVIFTSDNGATHEARADPRFHVGGADPKFFNSTAGLRGYKGSVYEGGIRVPMIARLPGRIAAGVVNDTPGYFADWFPTLCEAAGLKEPGGLDGESLWPVLRGGWKRTVRRKPMLWVFPENEGQVAVRLGRFKLVRQRLKTKSPGAWEVYDLYKDRAEARDIAASHSGLIRQAEEVLRREVGENRVFPLSLPRVGTSGR
jgi:arylsulfatase A-like enzyme